MGWGLCWSLMHTCHFGEAFLSASVGSLMAGDSSQARLVPENLGLTGDPIPGTQPCRVHHLPSTGTIPLRALLGTGDRMLTFPGSTVLCPPRLLRKFCFCKHSASSSNSHHASRSFVASWVRPRTPATIETCFPQRHGNVNLQIFREMKKILAFHPSSVTEKGKKN